ncbi:extracellular solute-binding protein [Neptuniibacter sp. 2_MG-2023]|uniref:extracellular solute-binding protein n=1 Tax=Neptuniibacter sp. 2_MG-2023 TaxID=3062671 RepID=UPI0026E36985|nr:extracellular solute-binding protein [Neptuniibacter sp. 2_MG-2023]MDO6514666.1 extracellular solute-binding protein [Neptuniibacter sp. 2_MG-2023]
MLNLPVATLRFSTKLITAVGFTIGILSTPVLSHADAVQVSHGISMHGDLKYPKGFSHFDYVNPKAPKGGKVTQSAIGTFDSFNQFIVKGNSADGLGLIYDTLLGRALDEPFSLYGLIAENIEVPKDRSWIIFNLRKSATFSDNHPLTAEDVVFSFEKLRSEGAPFYKAYYADIDKIEALNPHRVKFTFKNALNRELALIVGEVPILAKHYWQGKDFQKPSLDIPIGSGPYIIDSYDAGRSITYKRNPNYWAKDLPVKVGYDNFDIQIFDYYRDGTVAMEAFKAGEYDFRQENSSKRWATSYTGQSFDDGRIKIAELEHQNPTGMQAFVINNRREQFSDPRVRQALALAFDFEWTNKNIFFNAYTRTHSFFSNSEMAATKLPTKEEIEILEPVRDQVPPQVFTQVYKAPETNGDGKIYTQLRQAKRLLQEAGWAFKSGKLINAESGKPLKIEMLLYSPAFERVVSPFIRNLERLGIEANIRLVDVSQYIARLRSYDFDIVVSGFGQSSSPGNEQRDYWHSSSANKEGSRNLIGIQNPAIDYLVEQLIQSPDREQLVLRTRALDRVLQWNHYVIPQYHINKYRVAYWDKFAMPETRPKYALGFNTWWIKPDKDAK